MFPELYLGLGIGLVSTYTVTLVLAFLLAIGMTTYLGRWTTGARWWKPLIVALAAAIPALPGARLLSFLAEPTGCTIDGAADLWSGKGGLAFLGGVGLGIAGAWLACVVLRVRFLSMADAAAPSVLLADAVGRFGCLAAGCCFGRPTTGPFAAVYQRFDTPPRPVGVPLHPTQLYESLLASALAIGLLVLLARPRFRSRPGITAAVGLAGYAIGRFAIEFLRADPRGGRFGLSTSQWGSLVLLSLAAVILATHWHRASRTPLGRASDVPPPPRQEVADDADPPGPDDRGDSPS